MRIKRVAAAMGLLGAAGIGAHAYRLARADAAPIVQTAEISRGDIIDAVATTGTVQAVTTVQVGSQASGNISRLGADFNSIVHKGQMLATLDPSLFEAEVEQARANLNQTRANLTRARSDLVQMNVQLVDAQQKYTRASELAVKRLIPQSDLDAAKIAVDAARAGVTAQQATVEQTQAAVRQSEASVDQTEVNVAHTIITAPIDGIVIQRSVDVGQTVAASLQSPTLFVIAADLTKLQVSADIDEVDIGRVRPGQTVTFRVDAYPQDRFSGTVSQVRLQPAVVQNVTTYTAIIDVANADLKLKPGMTANAKVEVARRSGAVRVPNTALRFRPTRETFAALKQKAPPDAGGGGPRVWLYASNQLDPVRVQPGISDGAHTELVEPALQPGTPVAIGLGR